MEDLGKLLAIRILAVVVLAIDAASTGVAGYAYFVALPPIMSTVDQTVQYLSDLRAPEIDLEQSAAKIRSAAANMPTCADAQYGGCTTFDLRQTKADLESLAVSLEETDGSIKEKVASLEERIHQVAGQLAHVRLLATGIVGWMLAISIMLMISGITFLLIDKKIEARPYRAARGFISESEA